MSNPADRPATGNMTAEERRRADEEQRARNEPAGTVRRPPTRETDQQRREREAREADTRAARPGETEEQRRERERRANADPRTGDRTVNRVGETDIREASGTPGDLNGEQRWPHVQTRADQSSGADVTSDVARNMGSTTQGAGVQQDGGNTAPRTGTDTIQGGAAQQSPGTPGDGTTHRGGTR